jgi:hypothetical protein
MRDVLGKIVGQVCDRDLVFAFFATFSRFEYALKRTRFLKQKEKAEPDWDKFSNHIRDQLHGMDRTKYQKARAYLLNNPPKTQVIVHDRLEWQATLQGHGESEERYLLRLVATVRNNLFHGGKYPVPLGPVPDVVRNRELLTSALTVLECCLELSPAVRSAFGEVA